MKSKVLTYALLIVVAIIWYQVFLRIKSNVTTEKEWNSSLLQNTQGITLIQKDTFLLDASYRDPFMGKAQKGPQEFLSPESVPVVEQPVKPTFMWPKVNYYGWVRKSDSKNPLCIVNIDGLLLYLRKGDEIFDGIHIVTVDRDFIQLKKGRNYQSFYRK